MLCSLADMVEFYNSVPAEWVNNALMTYLSNPCYLTYRAVMCMFYHVPKTPVLCPSSYDAVESFLTIGSI